MWFSEKAPHKFYKAEYLAVVRQYLGGVLGWLFVCLFCCCCCWLVCLFSIISQWLYVAVNDQVRWNPLERCRDCSTPEEQLSWEDAREFRVQQANKLQSKAGNSSLCTDQQGLWVHTQSAVNVREPPAKPQCNWMKFLRAKCDCLDLHQRKTFFSWPRPSDKAMSQLWIHMG